MDALGPTDTVGMTISQWMLVNNGKVLPKLTAQKLTMDEILSLAERTKRDVLDRIIRDKCGTHYVASKRRVDYIKRYKDDNNPPIDCLSNADD